MSSDEDWSAVSKPLRKRRPISYRENLESEEESEWEKSEISDEETLKVQSTQSNKTKRKRTSDNDFSRNADNLSKKRKIDKDSKYPAEVVQGRLPNTSNELFSEFLKTCSVIPYSSRNKYQSNVDRQTHRLLSNRASAQRSRDRKKGYIVFLEQQTKTLKEKLAKQNEQNSNIENEIALLKNQANFLKNLHPEKK